MTCSCGHDAETQHAPGPLASSPCQECRCPDVTAITSAVLTMVNGRWPLYLPPHRAYRREWPWWEAARLAAMHHFVMPGDVVYDIGAEEGDFPALWATWGCEVVAVEPNPKVWPNIRAVFEANGLSLLACWVGFAGAPPEGWSGRAPAPTTGWPLDAYGPVVHDHGFVTLWERDDLPRTTIDELAESSPKPPTVITIDVEGGELQVLLGARETLAHRRPLVFVSLHPDFMGAYDDDPVEVFDLMESLDYRPTFLAEDHEQHFMWTPKERTR